MTPHWLSLEPLVAWPTVVVPASVIAVAMAAAMLRRPGSRRSWLARAGMVVVAAGTLLGPHVGTEASTFQQRPEAQVVVALDRTASMAVEDQQGERRWESAVADVVALADSHDASFALVTWGSGARLAVPFTTDSTALESALRAMETERPVVGVGSRLDRPLGLLNRLVSGTAAQHPGRETFLLLLSDGENTAGGDQRSFAALAPLVTGGVVVGYGSDEGGPVPLDPGRPSGVVPDPRTGRPAVSRRSPENLQQVASQLGIDYRGREELATVGDLVSALEPATRTVAGPGSPRDVTWLLGLVLLGLVALDLRLAARGVRELRDLRSGR